MTKLKPPRNFREIAPRSCGTCQYLVGDGWEHYCERSGPNGEVSFSSTNIDEFFYHICDRYKKVNIKLLELQ